MTYEINKEQMNLYRILLDGAIERWEFEMHQRDGWGSYLRNEDSRKILKSNREFAQRIKFELEQITKSKGVPA